MDRDARGVFMAPLFYFCDLTTRERTGRFGIGRMGRVGDALMKS